MDMTALIGAVGIAIPSLAAALALWRKLRNAKDALNDNVTKGLKVVKDLEQAKAQIKKVESTYSKVAEKLTASENLLTTLEDAASSQIDAEGVGIDFLVKKLEVPYSVAYRMAKAPESPFNLEHIPRVGKRWRANAGSVQDWLGR